MQERTNRSRQLVCAAGGAALTPSQSAGMRRKRVTYTMCGFTVRTGGAGYPPALSHCKVGQQGGPGCSGAEPRSA